MIHEKSLLEANVALVLRGPDGREKDRREIHNLMTTAGKAGAADQLLVSPTLAKPGWIAIGTGTPASTLLGAEVDRNSCSKTRSGAIVTLIATFGAGEGTGTITEAGIFDVVTPNTVNMWCSSNFTGIVKAPGDSLQITWTLTQG